MIQAAGPIEGGTRNELPTQDVVDARILGRRQSGKTTKPEEYDPIEGIYRAGDDSGFLLQFPPNQHGVLFAMAILDGVSEGGMGHECSFNSAREIRTALYKRFVTRPRDKRYTNDEIGGTVADPILSSVNHARFREGQNLLRAGKLKVGTTTYGSSLALALVQDYDREGRRVPLLHTWFTADSDLELFMLDDKRIAFLLGLNLPHNIPGALVRHDLHPISQQFADPDGTKVLVEQIPDISLAKIRALYDEQKAGTADTSGIYTSLGSHPDQFRIYYQRVVLPQAGETWQEHPLTKVRVVGMTDGLHGYSTQEQRMNTLGFARSLDDEVTNLLNLVQMKDPDDRMVASAQISLKPTF